MSIVVIDLLTSTPCGSHTRGELDSATPWRGRGIDCDVRSTGRRGDAPPTCG